MASWLLFLVAYLSVSGSAASTVGDGISTLSTDVVNAAHDLINGQTAVIDAKLGITTLPPPTTAAPAATGTPAPYVPAQYIPIPYTHLWVSSDGNTHIAECTIKNLTLASYVGVGGLAAESYVDRVTNASAAIIVQLPAGEYNPPHTAPAPQFEITLQGSWYVQTSDGTVRRFSPGNGVLFQDNSPLSPAINTPNAARHISGNDGTVPCNMFGAQVDFPPTVDHPCPF